MSDLNKPILIVVCGPTASGKSKLAVLLSQMLNGEVVNIDSVQLYEGLDIGSGKITLTEQDGVTHHLLDIRKPDQEINVAEFIVEAERVVRDVQAKDKIPILVGGTSLYVKCFFHGIVDAPAGDSGLRMELEDLTLEELRARLKAVDPGSLDAINPNDKVRMIRAIEVAETAGVGLSILQEKHRHSESRHHGLFLILTWPRKELYERIDRRCREMIDGGLIEETEQIISRYGRSLRPLKSLGYAQALSYLEGKITKDELFAEMATKTRQFAKRQLTFWRNQPLELGWKVKPLPDQESGYKHGDVKEFNALNLDIPQLKAAIEGYLSAPSDNRVKNEAWYISAKSIFKDE